MTGPCFAPICRACGLRRRTAGFTLYLERLEETLGKQNFFFGTAASIADFSIYHNLWFVVRGGPVAKILESFPALNAGGHA